VKTVGIALYRPAKPCPLDAWAGRHDRAANLAWPAHLHRFVFGAAKSRS
jgi:hypothetical protein